MRVPRPPASTTAAGFRFMGRKVLGRQDSNLGSRDQNPLPYHLATPHRKSTDLVIAVCHALMKAIGTAAPAKPAQPLWSASQATPWHLATPQFRCRSLASCSEEQHQRERGEDPDSDDRERPDHNHEDRDQHHEGLRDGRNPGNVSDRAGAQKMAQPEEDDNEGDRDRESE